MTEVGVVLCSVLLRLSLVWVLKNCVTVDWYGTAWARKHKVEGLLISLGERGRLGLNV